MDSPSPRPSFFDRISSLLSREPEDRDDLRALLHSAFERQLLDADALTIIEGALNVSDMQVRDVMVPRAQMDVIRLSDSIEAIARFAIQTAHSRFPVVGDSKDDVHGIFLAKDLLRHFAGHDFRLAEVLRPAVFVPESKRLNVLLREFRISHNHMAIVVDEYGGVAGLVTIEDVLEQIVGEIEDEFDADDSGGDIRVDSLGRYRVRGTTELADFNAAFGTTLSSHEVETIGGLVSCELGRVPRRGESLKLEGVELRVLRADGRRIYSLLVTPRPPEADGAAAVTAED